jgi:hypothetical protein
MTKDQQLARLREAWKAADSEERYAIGVTAQALKADDPRHRDTVQRRVAAHLKLPPPEKISEEQPNLL